ncbi:MAG: hypothetical protein EOO74_08455 [Myxococcales bacterium]|nr:MAG: hypothetical protein EOO74_08455 [Myxococcales bacterium]
MSNTASLLAPISEDEMVRLSGLVHAASGITGNQANALHALFTAAVETSRQPRLPLATLAHWIRRSEKVALRTVAELEAMGLVRVVLRELAPNQRKPRPIVYEVNERALVALDPVQSRRATIRLVKP